MCVFDAPKPQQLPPPPAPVITPEPKVMLSPEQAKQRKTSGAIRQSSKNPLRVSLGGTTGSSGLNVPT